MKSAHIIAPNTVRIEPTGEILKGKASSGIMHMIAMHLLPEQETFQVYRDGQPLWNKPQSTQWWADHTASESDNSSAKIKKFKPFNAEAFK